jgi:2-iminobutanoate/2-iminopropanoate deaminase
VSENIHARLAKVRQLVSFQAVLSERQTTPGSKLTICQVTAIGAEKQPGPIATLALSRRPVRWACQCLDGRRIAKRIRNQRYKENTVPRTKVSVPDVAEVGPDLWSNAVRAGDMLYISGQVARPFEGGSGIVGKDEYEQTRQIFSRIERIIKAAGGTMDDLVKMTIYVVDISKNTEVWRARREFFSGDFPASTLVEVRSLAKPEVLVEIETVAYLGTS